MQRALISVIVPVYKVEKCIHKCIESIINQTYDNLEIILIDDGSPDNCPKICDEYALRDNRIKVIHQENKGLSSARNKGIELAKGEYIGFVDSDDYIEPSMFQDLYNAIVENNVDISICNFYVINDKTKEKNVKNSCENKQYNKMEALKEILLDTHIQSYAWNKLYKRNLFEDVKYPVGKKYEDIGTTFYLFERSNKIQYIGKPEYNYLNREDSIVFNYNEQTIIDYIDIIIERYKYVEKKFEELKKYNFYYLAKTLITAYNDVNSLLNINNKLIVKVEELYKLVKEEFEKYGNISYDLFNYEQRIRIKQILRNEEKIKQV